ncbi:unnamed protein product [Chondrus crispus]|uniref:Uncharacterized protein n=1 Tax=Chondrus crispus TaxID=2769 RepID=R7QE01_CHOCR|nr:unnamed protein product [Chondrus crispus]CDF36314.1 unnamed protein product [Chondrus crispus]|eukprot:XP_005716133.1 unnamed protein product [Chondrus crispus]
MCMRSNQLPRETCAMALHRSYVLCCFSFPLINPPSLLVFCTSSIKLAWRWKVSL